uniref:NB-ARC domain-containing protein n=1 Tax=uncultured Chloroflexus sp. TaxID=214040 RepID=UPI00260E5ABA
MTISLPPNANTTSPRIALVIGINHSPTSGLAPLRHAEATAQQVASALAAPACGFTLHGDAPLIGDRATTDAVRSAVFAARRAAGRDGMLLIYYIGHARYLTWSSGRSDVFLVTANFNPDDARDDPDAHLSMTWLQEKVLRHGEPDRLLLVLDCCYAGAIGNAAPDPAIENLKQRLANALNIQHTDPNASARVAMRKALTAVSPFQQAYERDGATCYSATLLRGLHGKVTLDDGSVTCHSLHALAQRELPDWQPGEYGFDRSPGVTLASFPERARLRPSVHQPFVMPHPPQPDFVGRDDELAKLAALLTGDEPASAALLPALAGVGGIGKTRLAIEFAHRYRNCFPGGVFWLSMENGDTIERQVAACGGTRGLQIFDDDDADEAASRSTMSIASDVEGRDRPIRLTLSQRARQVQAIWEGPEKRLLIFDNLEDPALLERWRPRGGGARLLITTRRAFWEAASSVQPIPLASLTAADSRALLLVPRARAQGIDIDQMLAQPGVADNADQIAQELGGLPLALTLAGQYLARYTVALSDYLNQLRAESVNHRSLNAELSESLPQPQSASIIASFALSVSQLGENDCDRLARAIWLAAARLAPEPIPLEALLRAGGLDPMNEAQRRRGEDALRRLRETGLIEQADQHYRLHRLLAAYARSLSSDHDADLRRAARGIAQTIRQLDDQGELTASLFREHIRLLLQGGAATRDADGGALWHAAGLVMYADNDYAAARRYFTEAL